MCRVWYNTEGRMGPCIRIRKTLKRTCTSTRLHFAVYMPAPPQDGHNNTVASSRWSCESSLDVDVEDYVFFSSPQYCQLQFVFGDEGDSVWDDDNLVFTVSHVVICELLSCNTCVGPHARQTRGRWTPPCSLANSSCSSN